MILRIPRFASALLLIAVALFAEGQKPAEPPKPTASLSGTILSAVDGTPVRGAIVYIYRLPTENQKRANIERETTRTAGDGTFSFDKLSAGRYSLSVRKPGFNGIQKSAAGRPMSNIEVTLATDQKLTGQELRLLPAAVVIGRVVDEEGSPLMHVSIEARRWMFLNGRRMLMRIGDGNLSRTNDLGEYRLYGLLPGRYYLAVSPEWYMDSPSGRLLKTYYSNSRTIENATPITLAAGDEIRADFNLVHIPGVKVTGKLTGPDVEADSSRFMVELRGEDRSDRVSADVNLDGTFEAENVTPGDYELVASTYEVGDMSGPKEVARTKIEVPTSGVQNLSIAIAPTAKEKGEIQGTITSVEKDFRPGGWLIILEKSESQPDDERWGSNAIGTSKPDGTFKMNAPEQGTYYARTFLSGSGSPYNDWYIESVEYNGRDFTNKPILLPSSASGTLRITMSSKSAVLEGTVADHEGKALAQAQIMLLPSDGSKRPDLYQTAQSDQNGRFKMRGIVPGNYTVIALSDADADAAADPNFIKTAASRGTSVRFDFGARQAVALKVASDISPQ